MGRDLSYAIIYGEYCKETNYDGDLRGLDGDESGRNTIYANGFYSLAIIKAEGASAFENGEFKNAQIWAILGKLCIDGGGVGVFIETG